MGIQIMKNPIVEEDVGGDMEEVVVVEVGEGMATIEDTILLKKIMLHLRTRIKSMPLTIYLTTKVDSLVLGKEDLFLLQNKGKMVKEVEVEGTLEHKASSIPENQS
jgi:hypothetical protein